MTIGILFALLAACGSQAAQRATDDVTPDNSAPPTLSKPAHPNTVVLWSSNEVPDSWKLAEVIRDWNRNGALQVEWKPFRLSSDCESVKATTIRCVEILISPEMPSDEAGHYQLGWDDGQAIIVIYSDVPEEYRQTVLCHEVGHALGLLHPEQEGRKTNTCMSATTWNYKHPNKTDLQIVRELHPELT
jgi:hypothetical protein